MKYILIVNPMAGKDNAVEELQKEMEALPQHEDCELYQTKGVWDANLYVKSWCKAHPGEPARFIACGGDGTLNEVANGVTGFPNVSLGCYACGSGNDFVKTFGGQDRFRNLQAIVEAPNVKLDLLKVGERYSVNVVHFGFDTTVADYVNHYRQRHGHGGMRAYTGGILKALATSMHNTCTVKGDGEILNPEGEILMCTAANGGYVGGSFHCAPHARTDDGLIELCVIKPVSRLKFARCISAYINGTHLEDKNLKDSIEYRQVRCVEVQGNPGFSYSQDGEIVHADHFVVTVVPGALDFALPES